MTTTSNLELLHAIETVSAAYRAEIAELVMARDVDRKNFDQIVSELREAVDAARAGHNAPQGNRLSDADAELIKELREELTRTRGRLESTRQEVEEKTHKVAELEQYLDEAHKRKDTVHATADEVQRLQERETALAADREKAHGLVTRALDALLGDNDDFNKPVRALRAALQVLEEKEAEK